MPPSASFIKIKIDTPGLATGTATGAGTGTATGTGTGTGTGPTIGNGDSGTMLEGGTGAPADGSVPVKVGALVCAFDTAKRETDGTMTEDGTNEGRTVGASKGVGIGATPVGATIRG